MKNSRSMSAKSVISIVLLVLVFTGAGTLGYLYLSEKDKVSNLEQEVSDLKDQIPLTAEEEVAQLLEKVGSIYELPSDETPVVATVEDITKFEDQPFFEKAENGDKLLIFNDAKWAFLYRPSTEKIVNSGPTAEGGVDSQVTPEASEDNSTESDE